MRNLLLVLACARAFHAPGPTGRAAVRCDGAKTDAVLGLLRRVPLAGRLVRKRAAAAASPAAAPPTPAAPPGSDIAALAALDDASSEAAALLQEAVKRELDGVVERGFAVPFEAGGGAPSPVPAPEPEAEAAAPEAVWDAMHSGADYEPLLDALRAAQRASGDAGAVDAELEWRYARGCLDVADARGDATREGLIREGLEAARRAAAVAPANGLAQKWLGVLLGSVGDFEPTKQKLANSFEIKQALDKAYAARPDDPTVALALGQWCLKVASVSFVERGLARAIFGGSPPESTLAEARDFFQKSQDLRPAPKTKALIKLVEKKMKS